MKRISLYYLSIFCWITFNSSLLQAEESALQTYNGKVIIPRPNIVWSDSSQYAREKKSAYVLFGAGLIAQYFQAGIYINPDLTIDTSFVRQQDVITGYSIMSGLGFSIFVENSLYFRVQGSYRKGDAIDYKRSIIKDEEIVHSTDFGIDLALGNRWSWQNFLLGGEWIGIYFPILGRDVAGFELQFRVLMVHLGWHF